MSDGGQTSYTDGLAPVQPVTPAQLVNIRRGQAGAAINLLLIQWAERTGTSEQVAGIVPKSGTTPIENHLHALESIALAMLLIEDGWKAQEDAAKLAAKEARATARAVVKESENEQPATVVGDVEPKRRTGDR